MAVENISRNEKGKQDEKPGQTIKMTHMNPFMTPPSKKNLTLNRATGQRGEREGLSNPFYHQNGTSKKYNLSFNSQKSILGGFKFKQNPPIPRTAYPGQNQSIISSVFWEKKTALKDTMNNIDQNPQKPSIKQLRALYRKAKLTLP